VRLQSSWRCSPDGNFCMHMTSSFGCFARRSRVAKYRGFTLIEILTVVMILGILAALVVPSLTGFTTEASSSAAKSQLAAVRGQIEMYRLRHGGVAPAASGTNGTETLWSAMTAVDGAHPPLLQRTPALPRDYSWSWDGRHLRVSYAGMDEILADEVATW
jgi:type II secretion system protein G